MKLYVFLICFILILTTGCQAPPEETAKTPDGTAVETQTTDNKTPKTSEGDPKPETDNPNSVEKTTPEIKPAPFIPVVAGGRKTGNNDILLGSYENGQWIDADTTAKKIKGGELYSLYNISKKLIDTKGDPISFEDPVPTPLVDFPAGPEYCIAIGSPHKADLREVKELSTKSKDYLKIADDYLKSQGLNNVKAEIKQIYKVDLEGDGTDEVLINLTNLDLKSFDPYQKAGKYSVFLLRQVEGNTAKTTPIFSDVYLKDSPDDALEISEILDITSIVDVNGDGVLEILAEISYYEGTSFSLFELEKGQLKERLVNGWGL